MVPGKLLSIVHVRIGKNRALSPGIWIGFRRHMNWILIAGIFLFLCIVFGMLGLWHRSVQVAEDEVRAKEAREAEQEGANRALTQHPQIDLGRCLGCGSCVAACPENGVIALVEGKARLMRASHCVGHGCCEVACPVGALVVGLGDLSSRSDIPVLTKERETTVPGVFIAGELSGIGLIRNAVEQGTQIIDTIAHRLKRQGAHGDEDGIGDVLIVGCGPSGIAATLRAHELGLKYTVIDQDDLGGTVRKYPRNKMTMTQPVDLPLYGRMKQAQYSKEELIALWTDIFEQYKIVVGSGVRFIGLKTRSDGVLKVETSEGQMLSRCCILALGRRGTPRRLGVPGEDSERVLYQLVDAADYIDQKVLVVGGGDSAIEAALALAAQSGNKVTLSYRRNAFFRIKTRNRDSLEKAVHEGRLNVILNSQVQLIDPAYVKLEIRSEDETAHELKRIAWDFVFVFAGGEPPYPLLQASGIAFGGDDSSSAVSIREAS